MKNKRFIQLKKFTDRRLQTIFCFGFSSGLPLLLTSSTLQAWYTLSGMSLVSIGLLTLVGQPYLFKFLWAPFLDRFTFPFLGRRLGWVFICQVALIVGLIAMAWSQPGNYPVGVAVLALAVAFLSATQDVAIDAYRIEVLQKPEYGLGASLNSFGYRLAMLVSGGIAMIIADYKGWSFTYFLMAGLMAIQLVVTYYALPIQHKVQRPTCLYDAAVKPFRAFLSQKNAWALLLLIVIYRLNDAFAASLTPAFLLRALQFTLTEVGTVHKGLGLISTISGTFIGGLWMLRLSLYRALFVFGIAQGLSVLLFAALAWVGKNYVLMVTAITFESFCAGLTSIAFVAFLTQLCDTRYAATQFALFTALASVGRVMVGPIAGVTATHIGWFGFFLSASLITVPTLVMLNRLREQI